MKKEACEDKVDSQKEIDFPVKMETVTITKNLRGLRLKKPLILKVPEAHSATDLKLRNFVIETFLSTVRCLAQFTLENASTMKIAKYLLFNRTGSQSTLYAYIFNIHHFCKWADIQPDQLIRKALDKNGVPKPKSVIQIRSLVEEFVAHMQTEKLAPSYIYSHVHNVLFLLRINGLNLQPFSLARHHLSYDRAPSREELCKLLEVAELREKAIIEMLATGGFRAGTLAKLQYRHVKHDLEQNVIPVHVAVSADITKGKYGSYYTYINWEATKHLSAYLDARRKGTRSAPPENIQDESPLFRYKYKETPLSPHYIYVKIHKLYFKAGLLVKDQKNHRNYELRAHSLRKFFRTEMAARGVQQDYIEFMMGHKVNTYHDIKMKGIEYLRGVYLTSGIGIQPKIKLSKIEVLKEIMCAWGLNPEEILNSQAIEQVQATPSEK